MLPISQILPDIINPNQELQKQESRPQRTGSEQSLIAALTSSKIKDGSLEDIKKSLRYVMVKVGLRSQNWPSDEEKQILIAHIVQHFGNNTIDEIKLAFDLAITGKLQLDQKDISCYENFSCLYFSQIMVAYRAWAGQTHAQIRREDDYRKMLEESKPKVLTNEEYEEWYQIVKQQIVNKIFSIEMIPELLYDWMDRENRIGLSVDEKREYYNKAAELKLRLLHAKWEESKSIPMMKRVYDNLYSNYLSQKEDNDFSENNKMELRRLSKKMVLFDLMTKEDTSNG